MGQEDYRELSSFLERFVRRVKVLKGAEGLCLTAVCALLLFSLGLGIEAAKGFFPYAPLAYAVLTVMSLVLLMGWTLFQCVRNVSRERAALYIEKKFPHLRNNLINSLQLYPQLADEKRSRTISVSMVLALLRSTRKQLQGIRVEELINTQRINAELRLLGLVFIPVLLVVLFNPSSVGKTFSLLLYPLKDLPPSQTFIDVTPKGLRVARGSSVTIQATASGAIPKSMDLVVQSGAAEGEERAPMENLGGGKFSAGLQEVQKTLQYRVAAGPFASLTYTIEAVDPPAVGNLRVTLYPPHYTGLGAQTIQGGSIQAIKGSTARIEGLSSKAVVKAKIALEDGRELPLKIDSENRKLSGNLVLFQSQKYQIVVEDALGFHNSPVSYEIRVQPDGFPTVELLRPTEDLQVHGDETLRLEFSARDDFRIHEIHLAVRIGDRVEKFPIEKDGNRKFIAREQFHWDLGRLGLREGDEVIYHLEVLDNDTISGPKMGSSRALRLRLRDLKGEHRQVADMIRDLSNQMLDLLAHHLERPSSEEKDFRQKADEITKNIEEVMRRTEKDRLSDFATWSDLEALKRNLRFTTEDLLKQENPASAQEEKERLHDQVASELERMSLLAEEVSKRLKAQEVASTAQDLMKSQERLLDSLERLKSGDKNLDAVLKELSNLANLLGSLQQSLSQFASRLPDEFMNSEAVRGLGFGEMFSALEEIRKKLLQGDIEGALQLARELFNQLASMVAALQGAQQSAMSSTMGRMQGEMMRSASELQQIAREQQEILVETETVNKESQGEREAVLQERLEQFRSRAMEELARLAELFPDEEREGEERERPGRDGLDEATVNHLVKNMIANLLHKDFSSFAEILGMAEKELGKRRSPAQEPKGQRAEAGLRGLRRGLEALLQEPSAGLRDEDKRRVRDLAHRQGVLKERTEELHERLNTLFQLFPSLDPKITQNIQEAGRSMGKAENRLSGLDSKGAVPPEREALDRLSQSQQQMQDSMQQLAQRGQMGRMPVAFLFRRGRFLPSGVLVPLPGMPQFPLFETEGGITGLDTERFRLPGKEEYKVPRAFREQILESLKQGVPPQLKEQIENYFKNLSE